MSDQNRRNDHMDKALSNAPYLDSTHLVIWGEPEVGTYAAHSRPAVNVVLKQLDGSMEVSDFGDVKAILIGDLDAIKEALK